MRCVSDIQTENCEGWRGLRGNGVGLRSRSSIPWPLLCRLVYLYGQCCQIGPDFNLAIRISILQSGFQSCNLATLAAARCTQGCQIGWETRLNLWMCFSCQAGTRFIRTKHRALVDPEAWRQTRDSITRFRICLLLNSDYY